MVVGGSGVGLAGSDVAVAGTDVADGGSIAGGYTVVSVEIAVTVLVGARTISSVGAGMDFVLSMYPALIQL